MSASVSFLSSPPPPRFFTCAIFRSVFDSRYLFFAPKPHGSTCYALPALFLAPLFARSFTFVSDFRSSLFAPKPHGSAYNATQATWRFAHFPLQVAKDVKGEQCLRPRIWLGRYLRFDVIHIYSSAHFLQLFLRICWRKAN